MNMYQFRIIAIVAAMLILNIAFSTWLLVGGAFGIAGASPFNRNPAILNSIPTSFSYQGTLRDASGNLINGPVNLSLRLYGVVTGGTALYTENFTNVNVRSGLFTVIVGDAQALPASVFDTFPLYLGISINNDPEMLPRQRLHPVPYAMQAASAQNALVADNLLPGGGVPGSITLAPGGAKQITFPDGGQITDSTSGMTLSGGGAGKTVTVAGGWNASATLDRGDSNGSPNVRSNYPVSMNRYVVEAPDQGSSPDTVPIDNTILTDFCQDIDGCWVSLYMRDWGASSPGLLSGISGYHLSLAAINQNLQREWFINNPTGSGSTGLDKDNSSGQLLNVFNACYMIDGEATNNVLSDSQLGFGLLNGSGAFDATTMTCVLIIED